MVVKLLASAGCERAALKKKLPAVLWAGTFNERKNAGLIQPSGLICADIDKIAQRVGELHDIARHDRHVVAGKSWKISFRFSPQKCSARTLSSTAKKLVVPA